MPDFSLGVTAIVKDEGLYIEEWLIFHHLQGVSKFFIYDNGSTDLTMEILVKYKDLFDITITVWPGECRQIDAYNHSIRNNRDLCTFMAFIDGDEFLYSPTGVPMREAINTFGLTVYNLGIIAVPWMLFGSNGHVYYTNELVIERFIKRAASPNPHCKSIVYMPKVIESSGDAHSFISTGHTFDEKGTVLRGYYSRLHYPSADVFRINHYHTKSENEYRLRCRRGRPDTNQLRDFESNFQVHNINTTEDTYLKDTYSQKIKEFIVK